jgi:exosome complex exonuclease RRP6
MLASDFLMPAKQFLRPLPEEMFYYARADTHFLLYIYDNMRNELIDRTNPEVPDENRIELVIEKSKKTSLLQYERQIYNADTGKGPGGWYSLLAKTPALFSSEQLAVFRAVHEWRDKMARRDDDSTAFVMPNHVIFSIAKLIPMDMVALLRIAHPISHSVKSRSGELLELIKTAKALGKQGPSMVDVLRPSSASAAARANRPARGTKSPSTPLVAIVDENHLVSEQSSFWGSAFGSSIWDGPTLSKQDNDFRLAVPLPQLSSKVYATSSGLADSSMENTKPAAQDTRRITPPPKESNEAFVLKRGARRQSDALSESEQGAESHDVDFADYEGLDSDQKATIAADEEASNKIRMRKRREKHDRRAAAKAAKAAAKAAGAAQLEVADEEEPFDYSKAESVLHGKRKGGEQEGRKSKKPFDPYTKSADAPKGMRRVQTERAGKSHTFRS